MKPHKISTHLAYSDNCYFHLFLSVVWLSWNFARFHEIQFHTNLKVSAFYLEKQKSSIPKKKKNSSCYQYYNKKALFTDSIFQKVLGTTGFSQPCTYKPENWQIFSWHKVVILLNGPQFVSPPLSKEIFKNPSILDKNQHASQPKSL